MAIHIFSGWGKIGGSTEAHINLTNLFNKNKIEATFYASGDWAEGRCRFVNLTDEVIGNIANIIKQGDSAIIHALPLQLNGKGYLNKCVYSCHETEVYPISKVNKPSFDFIHYVSEFQRDWHKGITFPHVVIPNVVSEISIPKTHRHARRGVAGVIGSIDSNKQTHRAIQKAIDDGYQTVLIFGAITDPMYFEKRVKPLIEQHEDIVGYMGVSKDKSDMYSHLEKVYHASKLETFNLVEAECKMAEIEYEHVDEVYNTGWLWDPDFILDSWKEALCL